MATKKQVFDRINKMLNDEDKAENDTYFGGLCDVLFTLGYHIAEVPEGDKKVYRVFKGN